MAQHATGNDAEHWDINITSSRRGLDINLAELWRYKDLLAMFVKKDIITVYKQTILGPIWFLIQPLFTTLIYVVIFGRMAKLSTDGVHPVLFYMGSVTLWNYFSETLNVTSKTFSENAAVFGKVYFPRLILPLSKVASGVLKLMIQLGLFLVVWLYFILVEQSITPNWHVVFFPALLLVFAAMGLGFGIIITSLTTKYRDLSFLVVFGIQLLMYATPVIYPLSLASPDKQIWLWLNPLTSLFEAFKFAFLGHGAFSFFWLGYSTVFTAVLLFFGVIIFNKVEKKFIDTV
ncbi:MAG: ABC transporter permease [Taibaiella sp.]|nr:ABC transporter permease [Taibaiella sp.]